MPNLRSILSSFTLRSTVKAEAVDDQLWAEDASMVALRETTIPVESSERFVSKLLRLHRLERTRHSATYWAPAVVGGMVAALSVLALLQILFQGPTAPGKVGPTTFEAKNTRPQPIDFSPPGMNLPKP